MAADLGVADALDETPQTASDLAASVNAHPDALGRVPRLLAAYGVFRMQGDDKSSHSSASRLLRTDHPQSMRAFAQMFALPILWSSFGAMDHSVRTGLPAAAKVSPEGFWAYFAQHPEEGRVFNTAMVAKAHGEVAGLLAAYDFSGFSQIGDIGGGNGHLLRAIINAEPGAEGILFDLPHVVEEAAGVASERLTLRG